MPIYKSASPQVMAVINLTPDSFFDGGQLVRQGQVSTDAALKRVERAIEEGADWVDLGGESTRPGAKPVSSDEELQRVLPALERIRQTWPDLLISLDTSNPNLIREADAVGIQMINDVRALQRPGALEAAARTSCHVCLMHMQGTPETMQNDPQYTEVVQQVLAFLETRSEACVKAGIEKSRLIFDPGIGFGKEDVHNRALLNALDVFVAQAPVLIGVSRKSLFGRLLGRDLEDRLAGSLALAYAALEKGAAILRVHDVAQTRDVVQMHQWLKGG